MDGRDITAALTGNPQARGPILWGLDSVSDLEFALREGDWKLMLDRQGKPRELYDLATDPLELFNQLNAEPQRAAALSRTFRRMHDDIQRDPLRPRS